MKNSIINEQLEIKDGMLYKEGKISEWQPPDYSIMSKDQIEKNRQATLDALDSVKRLHDIFFGDGLS